MSAIYRALYWTTRRDERGQTMAEYAVILGVIAIGVIVAITALSVGIKDALNGIVEILPGTGDGGTTGS